MANARLAHYSDPNNAARRKKWAVNNPEVEKAAVRKWQAANTERVKQTKREWAKTEKGAAQRVNWVAANRDLVRGYVAIENVKASD